jgi:hypothetical protein
VGAPMKRLHLSRLSFRSLSDSFKTTRWRPF